MNNFHDGYVIHLKYFFRGFVPSSVSWSKLFKNSWFLPQNWSKAKWLAAPSAFAVGIRFQGDNIWMQKNFGDIFINLHHHWLLKLTFIDFYDLSVNIFREVDTRCKKQTHVCQHLENSSLGWSFNAVLLQVFFKKRYLISKLFHLLDSLIYL